MYDYAFNDRLPGNYTSVCVYACVCKSRKRTFADVSGFRYVLLATYLPDHYTGIHTHCVVRMRKQLARQGNAYSHISQGADSGSEGVVKINIF